MVRGRADLKSPADEAKLLMEKIPQQDTLQADDLVITSDLGGIFPEGLVIGKVVQVRRRDGDLFQEAILEPAVEMTKLERLYVVGEPTGRTP